MAYEALLYLIKPFLIALLFSCLPSKASELSSALLLPTKFPLSSEKGTTQPLYSKIPSNRCFTATAVTAIPIHLGREGL